MFRYLPKKEQYPPDLIIQDELHLISGPLGSVVGIYEATIQEICSKDSGGNKIYPKIIASTATITRATDQMNQLYNNRFDSDYFKNNLVNLTLFKFQIAFKKKYTMRLKKYNLIYLTSDEKSII